MFLDLNTATALRTITVIAGRHHARMAEMAYADYLSTYANKIMIKAG
jgi:hypothetical protein